MRADSGLQPHRDALETVQSAGPLLLFDGVCNLCNASVQFVVDRDPSARVRFAPLQGDYARAVLNAQGVVVPEAGADPDSVLLVERGRVYERSTAALRVARYLAGAWPLLYGLIVVPRPLRDLVYRWVARNRYRWFGREATCRVPTPDLRARFVGEVPSA